MQKILENSIKKCFFILITSTMLQTAMGTEVTDAIIPVPMSVQKKQAEEQARIAKRRQLEAELKAQALKKENEERRIKEADTQLKAEALRKENEQLKQALATKVQVQASAPKAATSTSIKPEAISYSQHADILKVNNCQLCNELVKLPAGIFDMGSNDGYNNEKPIRKNVAIEAFELSKTEVTQAQWQAVMGSNPSYFKTNGANRPVEDVSWDDIQKFLKELNKKSNGYQYRLPTEAEWEYAARAGSKGKWSFGDDQTQLAEYAWSSANSQGSTQEVARKKPNAWGLYDMHGNVREFVADGWHANYQGAPQTGKEWQEGADNAERVLRGGSWNDDSIYLRSSIRTRTSQTTPIIIFGFRLARTADVGR